MKLHYRGKYDLNPDSLPHGEHMPNAVPFKEAEDMKTLAKIGNIGSLIILLILGIPAHLRCWTYLDVFDFLYGSIYCILILFPHELLHAICFKKDVYLYTDWKQGILFVVGPETMSKSRFVFLSLLPNIVFGAIPYLIGMLHPQLAGFALVGCFAFSMGAGDYYNVFHALTQMPKGARTYMHKFNSYWYMP